MVRRRFFSAVSNHEMMQATILRDAAKAPLLRMRTEIGATWPSTRMPNLFRLHRPVWQHLIVRALYDLHLLGDAPGQCLLMQRDIGPVLGGDLIGLLDELVALCLLYTSDAADE